MRKFKVGDRVKVVKVGISEASMKYVNKTGTVIRISYLSERYYVVLDIERTSCSVWEDEVQLIGAKDCSHIKQYGIVAFMSKTNKNEAYSHEF